MLVLSDIYYPAGWRAYIDGEETTIFKTNYLVRSIALPAGKHMVEFKFEPKVFYASLTISWITTVTLLGLLIYIIYKNYPFLFGFKRKNGQNNLPKKS